MSKHKTHTQTHTFLDFRTWCTTLVQYGVTPLHHLFFGWYRAVSKTTFFAPKVKTLRRVGGRF